MFASSPSALAVLDTPFSRGARGRGLPARMSPGPNSQDEDPARLQAELVIAMAGGDRQALGRLYDLLGRPLYSLSYRVLNDNAEAQDVVHDVFIQLWQKAADFDPQRGSVFAWAATLVRNRSIDRVRMRQRRAEILHDSATDIHPPAAGDEPDSGDTLWLQEKAAAVRAALGALAPDQRRAIELAFFGGFTQQQISDQLKEPLGTIKARIRRGLLKLREALPSRL